MPFHEIKTNEIAPEKLPLLIVNGMAAGVLKQKILQYLESGGAVLTEANIAKSLLNIPVKRIYLRYVYSQEDAIFSNIPVCDLNKWSRAAKHAQYLPNQSGNKTVSFLRHGKGTVMILPSGFAAAILEYGVQRLNFQGEGRGRFPSERVVKVSKGSIRRIIQKAIIYLYHMRKLPFVHLWHLPGGSPNLFGFRVDTDFSSREDSLALYEVCRRNNIRATWFVETRSAMEWIKTFAGMENQEIGYHCYRHRIFKGYRGNRRDFQQGMKVLRNAGIYPAGYAAPFGEWNPALDKVVRENGFLYSSEFALGYDDLPFYPYTSGAFSPVLQVPVHPISIGRLNWARYGEEDMLNYYRRIIRERSAIFEPVFLYHHPGQGRFHIFDKIFQEINGQNIPTISMGEYAAWWQRRDEIDWEATFENDRIAITSNCETPSICLRTIFPSGESALNPIAKKMEFNKELKNLPQEGKLTFSDPKELRKYTRQMLVHDLTWHYGKLKQ